MISNQALDVDLYRYLEQDERVLAEMAKSQEARQAHLRIAEQYRELAESAPAAARLVPALAFKFV